MALIDGIIKILKAIKRGLVRTKEFLALLIVSLWPTGKGSKMTDAEARETVKAQYAPAKPYAKETHLREHEERSDISVIIPVYNGERFLDECIRSVLDQSFDGKLQLICVDDGSSDSSREILRRYEGDSRVKLVFQSNKGISGARNRALEEANGRYIMFIDNDDMLDKEFFRLMYAKAAQSGADITKCGYSVYRGGKILRSLTEGQSCVLSGAEIGKKYSYNGFCWGTLYKAELFAEISFPEGSWYEDMLTRMILYPQAKTFCYVDKPLYLYRAHGDNASQAIWSKVNPKALDQLYLFSAAHQIVTESNWDSSREYFLTCQYEMGKMLHERTRGLPEQVTEAAFVCCCDIYDRMLGKCPELARGGKLYERLLDKAFKQRSFSLWKKVCEHTVGF